MSYPPDMLREEVAFLAHHLHWSYAELMDMDHAERRAWVDRVQRMLPDGWR